MSEVESVNLDQHRWTIRSDGPDGRVDHFYADTDEREVEVIRSARVEIEALAVLRTAVTCALNVGVDSVTVEEVTIETMRKAGAFD